MAEDSSVKLAYCGLDDSSGSWLAADVTLTVIRTDADFEQTLTCSTGLAEDPDDPDNEIRLFACAEATTASAAWKWEVVAPDSEAVNVEIRYSGLETVTFRCNVMVDEDASDSKLVYAEALTYSLGFTDFKIYNGARYLLHGGLTEDTIREKLDLQIYGDNADPRILEDSDDVLVLEYSIIKNGDTDSQDSFVGLVWDEDSKYSVTVAGATITGLDGIVFTIISSGAGSDTFDIYPNCASGQYIDPDGTCQDCNSGYTNFDSSITIDAQFAGCRPCSMKTEDVCPNADKTGCEARTAGQYTVGGWMCAACPAGTKAELVADDGFEWNCTLCPKGSASGEGVEECTVCNITENKYAPAAGFSSCVTCTGIVRDDTCNACEPGKGPTSDQNGGSLTCEDCEAGEYSRNGACDQCAVGKYQDGLGQQTCKECAIGTFAEEVGSTTCQPCVADDGLYSSAVRAIRCETVQSGYGIQTSDDNGNGIGHIICAAGTYGAAEATNWTCTECIATSGDYQRVAGHDSCSRVSAGYYVVTPDSGAGGALQVEKCPVGTYRGNNDGSFTACLSCVAANGKYQDVDGQTECKIVPHGSYIVGNGISNCAAGTYGAGEATSWGCTACIAASGEYQGETGQESCSSVTAGYYVVTPADSDEGARSVEMCPVGTYRGNNDGSFAECLSCVAANGKYQDEEGQTECKIVPDGSYIVGNGTSSCAAGTYGAGEATSWGCTACIAASGEYQGETGQESCSSVDAGYYVVTPLSGGGALEVKRCAVGTYRGNNDGSFAECLSCVAANGKYQDEEGQTECKIVPDGSYIDGGATGINACPVGTARRTDTASTNNFTSCTTCQATNGEYQNKTGEAVCLTVSAGFYLDIANNNVTVTQETPCVRGSYRSRSDTDYNECKLCIATDGNYQADSGQSECRTGTDIPDGRYIVAGTTGRGASALGICAAGTYRASDNNLTATYTECQDCPDGMYQPLTGQSSCKAVPNGYTTENRISITSCPAGTKQQGAECHRCVHGLGEYQNTSGKTYCEDVKPGYEANVDASIAPEICGTGTYSSNFKCVGCDMDAGEYQDQEGRAFCKIVDPGYELTGAHALPTPCESGSYSKGSERRCTKCDAYKKEYQNDEGSTYCKICSRGKVVDESTGCEGIGCKEDAYNYTELSDTPFLFSTIAAGETLRIACNASKTTNNDWVYRDCILDDETETASWGLPRFSNCPTGKTAAIEELKTQMDRNISEMDTTDLASLKEGLSAAMDSIMTDNSTDGTEVKLTARDVNDVAGTLTSIQSVIAYETVDSGNTTEEELVKMRSATTALKNSMANTITTVASSGEETLATVDDAEKANILNAVEALAGSMADDEEPIVTKKLAVKTISVTSFEGNNSASGNESEISLPIPQGMNDDETPKLSLGDMEASGASVAVFSEDAKDMFPDPSSAIEEDEKDEAETGTTSSKVNRTLNSCIVSLNFKESKHVQFVLSMKSNTTQDSQYSNKNLKRRCSFLNTTTTKWSSAGCTTQGPDADGNMKCMCNHTTSFAILLSISDIVDESQENASFIMFIINVTFLVLTFLAIAPFKKHRKRTMVVLQTQLVLSLILANIGFQVLGFETKVYLDDTDYPTFAQNAPCIIGVLVVQYLFLVVMGWMTTCAYTLHGKIIEAVKTFGKTDRFYVLKCLIVCWFLPALLPPSTYLTQTLMSEQENANAVPYLAVSDPAKNGTDCWVAAPWKWISFIIPMYLCLLINCVVFFMILRVLIRAAKSGSGTGFGRQVKGAVTIAVTVGVPWIVGIMTFEPMALIGQWAFIILTGLQGPTMFLTFVVLQEDVLGSLLSPFGFEVPEILQSPRSASRRHASVGISNLPSTFAEKMMARDKPFDPKGIDPNIDRMEKAGNVYCNKAPDEESLGDKSDVVLFRSDLPTITTTEEDHLYYECTHFPYDADAASIASHFPEPVQE